MRTKYSLFFVSLFILYILTGCLSSSSDEKINGRVHVTYWEKWTGFESDAMKSVIGEFNKSQDKIYVDMVVTSEIDRKTLVAIAGGNPPDIAGLWQIAIPTFADKNALIPLDDYAAKAGIKRENYIPIYWDMGVHRGHLYALPTTPASVALHWNKKLFREAGLDPNRPPKTIQELNEYARKLTKRDKNGNIIQLGFMPNEPGWWPWSWGYWFGGKIWNGKDKITCNSPENIRGYEWVQSFSKEYGYEDLQTFKGGFGNFSSPQNAFLCGKLAMEIQGVWMYNFIKNYAPDMEWGCAPFPSAVPGLEDVAVVETDDVVIPRDAKHPAEAFEFIKYLQSQKAMETLNMGQRKFSPLINVSDEFMKNHPHPYLQVFIDMAKSPNAFSTLDMGIWNEYADEMASAMDSIRLGQKTPKEALDLVQQRIQKKWDKELVRFQRMGWTVN